MELNNLNKVLSKKDAVCLLDIIYSSVSCTDVESFKELISRLRDLIPFDFTICVLACVDQELNITSYKNVNINYPAEWLNLYFSKGYHHIDPVVKENFSKYKLQYKEDSYKGKELPKAFLYNAKSFGLNHGYSHGVRSGRNAGGSLFSISGRSVERHIRTEIIIEQIIPHLHTALTRLDINSSEKPQTTISPREQEVLKWIKEGKSSWEASSILGISERTVNFHIGNIMQKLDATNRIQAVAIALEHSLIN